MEAEGAQAGLPLCKVCNHHHVQGTKCDICGHVGKTVRVPSAAGYRTSASVAAATAASEDDAIARNSKNNRAGRKMINVHTLVTRAIISD